MCSSTTIELSAEDLNENREFKVFVSILVTQEKEVVLSMTCHPTMLLISL